MAWGIAFAVLFITVFVSYHLALNLKFGSGDGLPRSVGGWALMGTLTIMAAWCTSFAFLYAGYPLYALISGAARSILTWRGLAIQTEILGLPPESDGWLFMIPSLMAWFVLDLIALAILILRR